jgi:hypothetical protein
VTAIWEINLIVWWMSIATPPLLHAPCSSSSHQRLLFELWRRGTRSLARPAIHELCWIGETIFVALMALSGPFSIFLAPMFMWQIYWSKGSIEKMRFLVLTAAIGLGAAAQAAMIVLHPYNPVNAERASVSSLDLWINIPLAQIMTTFGVGRASFFHGSSAALIGALGLVAALVLACQKPYRTQKLFMLLFAAFIGLGGLYKFRDDVASQGAIAQSW